MGDLSSSQAGGRLAAVLYVLCGLLVAAASLLPLPEGASRRGLEVVGALAATSGVVIWFLPWSRWKRATTLWVVPPALGLIALHNHLAANDGYRYGLLFLVAFAWIGLAHPPGTSVRLAPALIAAYLLPLALDHRAAASAVSSLAYAVPICVLVGEIAAWVSERVRKSELALRQSESRFRSLVRNAADVVTVVDRWGTITYDSPAIETMLGYSPDARVGTTAFSYVDEEDAARVKRLVGELRGDDMGVRRIEVRVRHADGSWRWCQAVMRNLLRDPDVKGIVTNLSDVTERHRALEAQGRVAAIVESSEDAIVGTTPSGIVTTWNRAAQRMYGYSAEEMVGRSIEVLLPAERLEEITRIRDQIAAGGLVEHFQTQRRCKDGTLLDVSLSVSPILDSTGAVVGAASIARDITAERQAMEALRESEAGFRLLFEGNPQPMWVYDLTTLDFIEVNSAAVSHYGYSREEFLAMRITDIRPPEDVAALLADVAAERPAMQSSSGWRHRRKNGEIINVEVASHKLAFAGHDAVLVAIQDVTERFRYEQALSHQALHDELTGLGNRRMLDRDGGALLATSGPEPTSLILIDIDQFKGINQTLGPEAGDELLRRVAQLIHQHATPRDVVARMGADEFAVLLAAPAPEVSADQTARDLQTELTKPMSVAGVAISIEVSVGLARYPEHGRDIGTLLQHAESALARAKTSLGRRAMYEEAIDLSASQRLAVLGELRRALEGGELVLHYQPKVDLRSGVVVGVEALVRWNHPTRGLLPPDTFIPLAERTGLIQPLTSFVLSEAVRQVAEWRRSGLDLTVSINLAAPNLTDLDLPFQIFQVLNANQVPASALEIEITETTVMSDVLHTTAVVAELSRLGVGLSIDDFGTGHSSLAKLRSLPISEIKLDKSFVGHMIDQRDDDIIVRSTIDLGRNLGLRVVAEGVEDAQTAQRLRDYACDVMQGYWCGRPQPADLLTPWLRAADATLNR